MIAVGQDLVTPGFEAIAPEGIPESDHLREPEVLRLLGYETRMGMLKNRLSSLPQSARVERSRQQTRPVNRRTGEFAAKIRPPASSLSVERARTAAFPTREAGSGKTAKCCEYRQSGSGSCQQNWLRELKRDSSGSPAWIRTTIHGSKGRCPTIRRPGKTREAPQTVHPSVDFSAAPRNHPPVPRSRASSGPPLCRTPELAAAFHANRSATRYCSPRSRQSSTCATAVSRKVLNSTHAKVPGLTWRPISSHRSAFAELMVRRPAPPLSSLRYTARTLQSEKVRSVPGNCHYPGAGFLLYRRALFVERSQQIHLKIFRRLRFFPAAAGVEPRIEFANQRVQLQRRLVNIRQQQAPRATARDAFAPLHRRTIVLVPGAAARETPCTDFHDPPVSRLTPSHASLDAHLSTRPAPPGPRHHHLGRRRRRRPPSRLPYPPVQMRGQQFLLALSPDAPAIESDFVNSCAGAAHTSGCSCASAPAPACSASGTGRSTTSSPGAFEMIWYTCDGFLIRADFSADSSFLALGSSFSQVSTSPFVISGLRTNAARSFGDNLSVSAHRNGPSRSNPAPSAAGKTRADFSSSAQRGGLRRPPVSAGEKIFGSPSAPAPSASPARSAPPLSAAAPRTAPVAGCWFSTSASRAFSYCSCACAHPP